MKKLSLFLIIALILGLCSCTHTHQYAPKVVAPTCTADGYTDFICSCGDRYQSNITAAGHTEQQLPAKDATCLLDGLTEGKVCSVCGAVLSPQESINATGHTYGDWTVAKQPTLTEPGQKVKQCAACGDQLSEEIPKLDDPGDEEYEVEYALEGGHFLGEYASIEELGDEFLADFNKYGDAAAAKETFQADSTAAVKVALANPEMLETDTEISSYTPSLEVTRQQNEISRIMDSAEVDFDKAKDEIMHLAQMKYNCCTYNDKPLKTEHLTNILADKQQLFQLEYG
jgi:hypothetical protein